MEVKSYFANWIQFVPADTLWAMLMHFYITFNRYAMVFRVLTGYWRLKPFMATDDEDDKDERLVVDADYRSMLQQYIH